MNGKETIERCMNVVYFRYLVNNQRYCVSHRCPKVVNHHYNINVGRGICRLAESVHLPLSVTITLLS